MSYAIRCNPHFYADDIHGNDRPHLRRSMDGCDVIALASREEAETLVRMLDAPPVGHQPRMLANGQYAAPEHKVAYSTQPAMTLWRAMCELGLQYDFAPDGSRIAFLRLTD